MGRSSLSVTMQTSSIRRICSSSWPDSASDVVSMSGNRRSMFSAVMACGSVVVVVVVDMIADAVPKGATECNYKRWAVGNKEWMAPESSLVFLGADELVI